MFWFFFISSCNLVFTLTQTLDTFAWCDQESKGCNLEQLKYQPTHNCAVVPLRTTVSFYDATSTCPHSACCITTVRHVRSVSQIDGELYIYFGSYLYAHVSHVNGHWHNSEALTWKLTIWCLAKDWCVFFYSPVFFLFFFSHEATWEIWGHCFFFSPLPFLSSSAPLCLLFWGHLKSLSCEVQSRWLLFTTDTLLYLCCFTSVCEILWHEH